MTKDNKAMKLGYEPHISVDEVDSGILHLHDKRTIIQSSSMIVIGAEHTLTSSSPGFCSGNGNVRSSITSTSPVLLIPTALIVEGYVILNVFVCDDVDEGLKDVEEK